MPRHRPLHRYPREYYQVFEKAQAGPYSAHFDSAQQAKYVRSDLYNLRAAVRAAIILDPDNAELSEQYLLMENVVIRLDDCSLHFSSRKYRNEERLRRALEKPSQEITNVFSTSSGKP